MPSLKALGFRYSTYPPLSLYRDQHSSFQRNDRHWTRAEELAGRQDPTQLGRVLEEWACKPCLSARKPPKIYAYAGRPAV
jgi:hypothetical protein